MPTPPRRPAGVTALAGLFTFGVLASGLSAVSLLTPGGPLEPMWRLNPRAREGFSHLGGWAPLLMLAVCFACAASAYGFLAGRRWGYRLGVALLLVNLAGDLANAALGIEPRAIVGVPVVAAILVYLFSRKARVFFSPASGAPGEDGPLSSRCDGSAR
jgi:hypothetical protein